MQNKNLDSYIILTAKNQEEIMELAQHEIQVGNERTCEQESLRSMLGLAG